MVIRPAPTRVLHTTRSAQNTWLGVARWGGQSEHFHIHDRTSGNNDLLEAYQDSSFICGIWSLLPCIWNIFEGATSESDLNYSFINTKWLQSVFNARWHPKSSCGIAVNIGDFFHKIAYGPSETIQSTGQVIKFSAAVSQAKSSLIRRIRHFFLVHVSYFHFILSNTRYPSLSIV
jgi:hypothetical protein